jgi:nucleoside-diphosphate-sugar epimerase
VRILVTGGAGYLGSILTGVLLENGNQVTVLDSFMWGQNSLAHLCHDPRLTIVRGDARNHNLVKQLVVCADAVIPLAALVGAPLCDSDPIAAKTTNLDAVEMLCRTLGPSQLLVIPITNSGYGVGEPGKECTEETPMRPISLYGRTKTNAEKAVLDRGNAISLRLATVFGMSPRMRLDLLVNDFVYRAVTDRAVVLFEADFKRNYIHVRDVARAFIYAINHFERMKNQAYNVGLSDANLSKRELCERIAAHVPGFTHVCSEVGQDPDKRDYIVSNAKIEAAGWRSIYSLDHGIRELIKGYAMIRNSRYGNV